MSAVKIAIYFFDFLPIRVDPLEGKSFCLKRTAKLVYLVKK